MCGDDSENARSRFVRSRQVLSAGQEAQARLLFLGYLRVYLPHGWRAESRFTLRGLSGDGLRTAAAIASWAIAARHALPTRRIAVDRVRSYFTSAVLPTGWRPADETDELLVAIFAGVWKGGDRTMIRPALRCEYRKQLMARLRELGHETATAFAATRPTCSLRALAVELGSDPTSALVGDLLFAEALGRGDVGHWARDLLVREIHAAHPDGWVRMWRNLPMTSTDVTSAKHRTEFAIHNWSRLVRQHLPAANRSIRRIEDAFCMMRCEDGWLPTGPDDPTIRALFADWLAPDRQHIERGRGRDIIADV